MEEGFKGYYTVCPVHDDCEPFGVGHPYAVDWRGRGKEVVGHYFPCCGTVCLKSTREQYRAVKGWREGNRNRKPRQTSLWVKEAIEGDTDIWRERGELDATYGFGEVESGGKPDYQVHEAITFLHTMDEDIGITALNQFFLAEPNALAWEMDDVMGSLEMKDDIRRHFNVNLFQLIQENASSDDYAKKALTWLERNALLSPDPFRATQSMFRLKAKTNQLPLTLHMKDINNLLHHTTEAGFVLDEREVTAWFEELKSYGVELDRSNIHPDYQP